jgi:hypothetical protein
VSGGRGERGGFGRGRANTARPMPASSGCTQSALDALRLIWLTAIYDKSTGIPNSSGKMPTDRPVKRGPMDIILIIIILILLFGGGFGYSRYGYRGGIGIGGILLIVLILYLVLGRV